jgi:hypothetical protein
VEKPENLSVAMAIVIEGVPEKFLFLVKTVQVAGGFGSVRHGGEHSLLIVLIMMRHGIQLEVGVCGHYSATRCHNPQNHSRHLHCYEFVKTLVSLLGPLREMLRIKRLTH